MDFNLLIYHFLLCILNAGKVILALQYIIGMPNKKRKGKYGIVSAVILAGIIIACVVIPEKYVSIVYLPIILIAVQVAIGIGNAMRILLTVISYICICEVDYFISAVARVLPKKLGIVSWDNLIPSAIAFFLFFLAAIACKKYDISFYKKNYGKKKLFIAIEVFVLFINFAIMGSFFGYLSENENGSYGRILLLLAITLSMFLSVITLIYYGSIMNVQEYKLLNTLNQQYLQIQKEHYETIRQVDRDTRKFRHDTGNHLNVVQTMLQNKEIDKAVSYLQEMTEKLEQIRPVIQCGNDIGDAILNEKKKSCDKKGIEFEVEGIIYAPLVMNDYDFCTILANGLDNAIEATEKVATKSRRISVKLNVYREFLHIIISNPEIELSGRRTTKMDKRNHGFGLENMGEVVDRNFGKIKIEEQDGMFVLDVVVKAFE